MGRAVNTDGTTADFSGSPVARKIRLSWEDTAYLGKIQLETHRVSWEDTIGNIVYLGKIRLVSSACRRHAAQKKSAPVPLSGWPLSSLAPPSPNLPLGLAAVLDGCAKRRVSTNIIFVSKIIEIFEVER